MILETAQKVSFGPSLEPHLVPEASARGPSKLQHLKQSLMCLVGRILDWGVESPLVGVWNPEIEFGAVLPC